MNNFICNKSCPNRTSFGYCSLTMCDRIRWTDKVSIDCDGTIRDFDGNIVGHLTEGVWKNEQQE